MERGLAAGRERATMRTSGRTAWLEAVLIGAVATCAQAQTPASRDTQLAAVRLLPPTVGTWRFRYELTLWTAPPVGIPVADSAAPLAQVTILADESLAGDGTLSRAVRGTVLDVPFLTQFGADGRALTRQLTDAIRESRAAVTLDRRNHVRDRAVTVVEAASGASAAGALLAAVGPLGLLPPLPARAVRPGDAWSDTLVIRIPGTALDEPIAVPATLRLVAIRAEGSAPAAAVRVAARIRHAALADGSTVDLTLTGETVIDLAAGVPVRATGHLGATVRDPRGATVPLRVRLLAEQLPLIGRNATVAAAR